MEDKEEEIQHLEKINESVKKTLNKISSQSINRLITELETGGNIRLEEGKGQEKWYHSCIDVIRSRFFNEEMK